jgi:hypothetical protein
LGIDLDPTDRPPEMAMACLGAICRSGLMVVIDRTSCPPFAACAPRTVLTSPSIVLDTDFDARRCIAAGFSGKRYVAGCVMLRVWIRTLDRRSGLAMPPPRTRSISAFCCTDGSTASTTISVILSCRSNTPADASPYSSAQRSCSHRYAIWHWMTPSRPLSVSLVMELLEQRAHLDRRHFARIRHDWCDRVAFAVDLPGKDGRRRRAGSALQPRLAALTLGPGRSSSALFPSADGQLPVLARTWAGLILAGDELLSATISSRA